MTSKIIGLTGRKRAGKDSAAQIINQITNYESFNLSFAGPLKKAVSEVFGIQITDQNKEIALPLWNATPRQLLQNVGDQLKTLYQDIFIRSMESRIHNINQFPSPKDNLIIITDVRFNNEAEYVLSKGGVIIEINADQRLGKRNDNHCSEDGIDQKYVDYVIYNNDDTKEFKQEIERLLIEHNY